MISPLDLRFPAAHGRLVDGVQVLADANDALATALDRRVVGRARDGILGRGVTVLRYHVWAMSDASCHVGSFRLVSLVRLVSYPQPPPFREQGCTVGIDQGPPV